MFLQMGTTIRYYISRDLVEFDVHEAMMAMSTIMAEIETADNL